MASVQDRKPPGADTKVNPGREAPISREGAGLVAPESLAAQSYEEGGGFAENRNAQPESTSRSETPSPDADSTRHSPSHKDNPSDPSTGTTPADIDDLQTSGTKLPHGKNLKEEDFDDSRLEDGIQKAFRAEPGSIDDPSRLAEARFTRPEAAQPDATAQRDSKLSTTTAYDHLSPETSS